MSLEYQNEEYEALKRAVDEMISTTNDAYEYETKKGYILAQCDPYMAFLARATRADEGLVRRTLLELSSDDEFFGMLANGLNEIAAHAKEGRHTAEIRIHSHTVYAAVRLLKPTIMVETGVANGKSSALILRAMQKNADGRLFSVDLPALGSNVDGSGYAFLPPGRDPGWLVPDSLRSRWDLRLGDAKDLLPVLSAETGPIDIFMHDSLHTYQHMTFEIGLAKNWLDKSGTVMCDDIQGNPAFEEQSVGMRRSVFGTFGFLWR